MRRTRGFDRWYMINFMGNEKEVDQHLEYSFEAAMRWLEKTFIIRSIGPLYDKGMSPKVEIPSQYRDYPSPFMANGHNLTVFELIDKIQAMDGDRVATGGSAGIATVLTIRRI